MSSTPTPGKNALSQQGRTPSQPQHGAAATPQVSTPFSVAQAALSPHGARSSPQQVKKSPANMASATLGRSNPPVNFASPSVDAAVGSLDLPAGLDMGLRSLSNLGRATDDERAMRLDAVISVISRNKGLVSEVGLERLMHNLRMEFMWENSMDSSDKRTLYIAGSALELVVEFSNNVVQSVVLSFPESAEIVNKHAKAAGEILWQELRLRDGQSPLTKSLAGFAANFERLAVLDKLSINPGLNLYEAIAGIYESLNRLHAWELRTLRLDPLSAGKNDEVLENLVLSTKSGRPTMNARGRVGMTLDYWRERRLQPVPPNLAAWAGEHETIWTILIGCQPLREIGVGPVRISDKWIGANIEKIPLPDELHTGGPVIDWLQPESTFLPVSDQTKADLMQPDASLLGPRLPEVVFHATFEPPVHIPLALWQQMQELGCVVDATPGTDLVPFESLVIPLAPGQPSDMTETRTLTCQKRVAFASQDDPTKLSTQNHANTLVVNKAVLGRTLTGLAFSHPQQLVTVLPFLRQYIFLAVLLGRSFGSAPGEEKKSSSNGTRTDSTNAKNDNTGAATTDQDDLDSLITNTLAKGPAAYSQKPTETPLKVDFHLTLAAVPRLQVIFPFRDNGRLASVTVEIQENGRVSVAEQNVLDDSNMTAPNGRRRRVEDIGALLEYFEDVDKWVQFMRTRWA